MKRKTGKKAFCLALACVVLLETPGMPQRLEAKTSQEIAQEREELEQKKEETKDRIDKSKKTIDNLKSLSKEEKVYLKELNKQMSEVTTQLAQTETEYDEKTESIEKTKEELAKVRQKEHEQYEGMKKRVKYVYENGAQGYMEVLLSAKSFSDFISRAEYVSQVVEYHEIKLEEYRKTKELVETKEEELTTQQEELEALISKLSEEKLTVAYLVTTTQDTLKSYLNQIQEEREQQKKSKEELEDQEEQINELKEQEMAQKAIEEAALRMQFAQQGDHTAIMADTPDGTGVYVPTDIQAQSELELMAAIIECEAGGEGYDGMLGVGSVVLNRVDSGYFPNTIAGVIYEEGQFQPVRQGRLAESLARGPAPICWQAAAEVLGGRRTLDKLFFKRPDGSEGIVIGHILFY